MSCSPSSRFSLRMPRMRSGMCSSMVTRITEPNRRRRTKRSIVSSRSSASSSWMASSASRVTRKGCDSRTSIPGKRDWRLSALTCSSQVNHCCGALPASSLCSAAASDGAAAEQSEDAGKAPQQWFTWLEQVIAANLQSLFPGMEVLESHPFRVTRDAELAIQELDADDLLETIERFVRRRRFGSVVRVTIDEQMPERIRGILSENLELGEQDIYTVKSPLGLSSLWDLQRIDRPDLSYQPLVQSTPAVLGGAEEADIFAAIRQRDILLHHPYDSFDPVVDFVSSAADDPDVLAINTTLYRVGRNAPVVDALMEAAANGKQVAVLLELKARFA